MFRLTKTDVNLASSEIMLPCEINQRAFLKGHLKNENLINTKILLHHPLRRFHCFVSKFILIEK